MKRSGALGLAASVVSIVAVAQAAGVVPAWAARSVPDVLRGTVDHVRDGDTIVVDKQPVRLSGVAAPERHEPLGEAARRAMQTLAFGRTAECRPDGSRSRDRIVAICFVNGRDIGAELIARGLARDCPRFSKGRYAGIEAAAGAAIVDVYPLPAYCAPAQGPVPGAPTASLADERGS